MTTISQAAGVGRRPHRLGAVAALTALTFGCTTIRTPVGAIQSPVPVRDGSAAPQLQLWLESAEPVSAEEAARVEGQARAALEAALAGREIGDGSTLLVVREQGVSRTASHRSDQTAATVGLVLGAVVVVIGLVYLATRGSGDHGGKGTGAAAAPPARGFGRAGARPPSTSPALPVAHAARPPPRPGALRPPSGGYRRGSATDVSVGVGVYLGPVPLSAPPEELPVVSSRELPGPATQVLPAPGTGGTAAEPEPGPEVVEPLAELGAVALPALTLIPLEERSFFAGDALVLELTLVDRVSGEPRWTKWVEEEADPCDAKAVGKVLDRAFAEPAGWLPAR